MEPSGGPQGGEGAAGGLFLDPYDIFICSHLRFYGYFRAPCSAAGSTPEPPCSPLAAPRPGVPRGGGRGALFAPSPAALPPPRWPIECEVIKEPIEHIEWVPPHPEPFCPPPDPQQPPDPPSEEMGTVVYHLPPVPPGSRFTRARVGGAPGPLSSPAAPLEGPQDTTLLFESRFESGNLQKAVKVGPYEYVLWLRPDLYTSKHTQWFYFRVQNTRRGPRYRFTIANLAKPRSLHARGLRPLLYSQRDARTQRVGWRRVGTDIRYHRYQRGDSREDSPVSFCLSWVSQFPHDGDTCFFALSYPYTYTQLRGDLRALTADPARSRFCSVRELCRSLAGNAVPVLTVTDPPAAAPVPKRGVVVVARAHPGESGGSWAMRGLLEFLLGGDPDARLLRRLFVFTVVPMLNPDGVVVGNSRCSLAGRDPNRAYGTGLPRDCPGVWHLREEVRRVLLEREVVLYCDFHGHSRKNNVFMYGCDGRGGGGAGLRQRLFPFMLSKNAPDKFSFPSCKFQVQRSKAGTGRVSMWHMGIANSYTMEVAFGGSTLGGRNSHFTTEDIKSLGYHLCDTLLDFCDPHPAKLQQCLSELDTLLRQRLARGPGSGGSWSDVSPSELESSTGGSDSSVSDDPAAPPPSPRVPPPVGRGTRGAGGGGARVSPVPPRRRKRRRKRRERKTQGRANAPSGSGTAKPGALRPLQQPPRPGAGAGSGGTGARGGRHAGTTGGAERDGDLSAVSPPRPPPGARHGGGTGDSSRDAAPGHNARTPRGREGRGRCGQGGPARGTQPRITAPRCCACARD